MFRKQGSRIASTFLHRRFRRRWVAVLFVAALALLGGIAYGEVAPGSAGVIQGCYDGGGNLKVVGALPCPRGHTGLQWNQVGPEGPRGVQGTAGDPGPVGPAGTSDAYIASDTSAVAIPAGPSIEVLSLSVPAGSYAIFAKARVTDDDNAAKASCALFADTAAVDSTSLYERSIPVTLPINLEGVASFGSSETLTIHCSTFEAGVLVDRAKIVAITVTNLH